MQGRIAARNTTGYGYDVNGNLTTLTDANSHTTENGFDLLNHLNPETLPTGPPTQTGPQAGAAVEVGPEDGAAVYAALGDVVRPAPDSRPPSVVAVR